MLRCPECKSKLSSRCKFKKDFTCPACDSSLKNDYPFGVVIVSVVFGISLIFYTGDLGGARSGAFLAFAAIVPFFAWFGLGFKTVKSSSKIAQILEANKAEEAKMNDNVRRNIAASKERESDI